MALELSIWKYLKIRWTIYMQFPSTSLKMFSVHISTIHGVKGLEYDAVFIPAFDKGTGRSTLASAYLVRIFYWMKQLNPSC